MEANIHGFQMDEHICDKLKHAALDIHCKTIEVLIFLTLDFHCFLYKPLPGNEKEFKLP